MIPTGLGVLLTSGVLYVATMKLLATSGNPDFAPTLIRLGSFLIPVACVSDLYESHALDDLALPILAPSFLHGGSLPVPTLVVGPLGPWMLRRASGLAGAAAS